jgi:hypothetical protein
MFIDTATQMDGRPALRATGSSNAPIRATAGEGQRNHEKISIAAPTIKKAVFLPRTRAMRGRIISSSDPIWAKPFDNVVIRAITMMIPRSSVAETITLLYIMLMAETTFLLYARPTRKIPMMQGNTISFFMRRTIMTSRATPR